MGTEATRLIVDYGFEKLGLGPITLEVLERNHRADRAYEEAGFSVSGSTIESGEDWLSMTGTRAA
jgi:RimJ/RimL family protein N-acetyltransferase